MASKESASNKGQEKIIVLGGAHSELVNKHENEIFKGIKASAKAGYAVLTVEGGKAVDAVEKSVRVMEDNGNFNAGTGSILNNNDEVECDAMIMDGFTMDLGIVTNARHFRNPVSFARLILKEDSPHCALSGDGACAYAREKNFPTVNPSELVAVAGLRGCNNDSEANIEYVYKGKPRPEVHASKHTKQHKSRVIVSEHIHSEHEVTVAKTEPENQGKRHDTHSGTPSAVAIDSNGHLACAASTGGIISKLKGRVGDTPMVGCGAYANEFGAAATTGNGDKLMKMTLAREVVYNMERGLNAQVSAETAMRRMQARVNGEGGVIAIDKNGNFGKSCNMDLMFWASIENGKLQYGKITSTDVHTEDV